MSSAYMQESSKKLDWGSVKFMAHGTDDPNSPSYRYLSMQVYGTNGALLAAYQMAGTSNNAPDVVIAVKAKILQAKNQAGNPAIDADCDAAITWCGAYATDELLKLTDLVRKAQIAEKNKQNDAADPGEDQVVKSDGTVGKADTEIASAKKAVEDADAELKKLQKPGSGATTEQVAAAQAAKTAAEANLKLVQDQTAPTSNSAANTTTDKTVGGSKPSKKPTKVSNLNKQLQAIHARLERIDDDLICHYAGMSQLVIAMLANPFTAASAALSAPTFNMTSIGQKLLKKLLTLIPGYTLFKKLQHLDVAALLTSLEERLAAEVVDMVNDAIQQVEDAIVDAATSVLNKVDAELAKVEKIAAKIAAIDAEAAALADQINKKNALDAARATADAADQALMDAIIADDQGLINAAMAEKAAADKDYKVAFDAAAASDADVVTKTANRAKAELEETVATAALSYAENAINNIGGPVGSAFHALKNIEDFLDRMTSIAKGETKSGIFHSR